MKKALKRRENTVTLLRRLIVAVPAPDGSGYSWTLAAALGEMLLFAEEQFGPRDLTYTLLGIDFTNGNDGGQIWTPGNCKQLIIQLDSNALFDRQDAYRQLAHESIHLLSPTGKRDANVLEEGLAVWFAKWYLEYVFGEGWWSGTINVANYANAYQLAKELLALDKDVVKRMREEEPVISRITEKLILKHCPAASRQLAAELAKPFYETPTAASG